LDKAKAQLAACLGELEVVKKSNAAMRAQVSSLKVSDCG